MSKNGNKQQDTTSQDQKLSQSLAEGKKVVPPASLETGILLRLGLAKGVNTQAGGKKPHRQDDVLAVQELAKKGGMSNVERINWYLRQNSYEAVRMAAVRALGEIYLSCGGVTWEPFIRAFGDKHAEVQATAVQVLMSFVKARGPEYLPSMITDMLVNKQEQKGTDDLVRITILQLFGMLGMKTLLLSILKDPDWQMRETAVLALAPFSNSLSSEKERYELSRKLYDANSFVRKAALIATRHWWPVEKVLEDLHDQEQPAKAARVLGEWEKPTPEIVEKLLELATNKQAASPARIAAILALAQLMPAFNSEAISNVLKERLVQGRDGLLQDKDEDIYDAATILDDVRPAWFPASGLSKFSYSHKTIHP
jgi:HEAT repeat protein